MRGWRVAGLAAAAAVLLGCNVQVHKDDNGKDKDVSVSMPFGHVEVHNDGKTADVGLPVYPGAVFESSNSNNGGAVNVNLGFGDWKLRVNIAGYVTPDAQDKVQAYYRKALAHYGDVLLCQGDTAVGTPTRTAEGLTCADDDKNNHVHSYTGKADLTLRAGSPRKQHLVAFEKKDTPGTHFALVALELPAQGMPTSENGVE